LEYAVDIVLLILFAGMVVSGAAKGFVKTVLGMVAMLAALFAAYQLSALLAPAVYNTFISEKVTEAIQTKLSSAADAEVAAHQISAVMSAIPDLVLSIASAIGIRTGGIAEKINSLDNTGANIAKELADNVAAPVITAVVHAVLFAVILAVAYVLLTAVVRLIDKIFKLPVLKSANRIMGGLLGAVKGMILVYLVCVILEIAAGLGKDTFIAQAAESSKIAGIINEHNFILSDFIS